MTEETCAEETWVIGFDIGSTAVKAGLFGVDGTVVDHWSRSYPTERPGPGLVEQDPQHWLDGVRDAIDALLKGRDLARVAAVGMCSQVNTEVFVDAEGAPLCPAITWQDVRAAPQAEALNAHISAEDKLAWWGADMPIGASHVMAKMRWMADTHPDLWARTRYVLSPKDYCLFKLTGQAVTDPISAFGQVGLDLTYIDPLLALMPGAAERLPDLRFFTDVVGEMPLGSSGRSVPVVAGTMDAWGNLFGCGVFAPGQGMYVSGTSEILAVVGAARIGAPGIVLDDDRDPTTRSWRCQPAGDGRATTLRSPSDRSLGVGVSPRFSASHGCRSLSARSRVVTLRGWFRLRASLRASGQRARALDQ